MSIYVFGYGSLMNPGSLQRTLPSVKIISRVSLLGYRRKINAPVDDYLYLNIVPEKNWKVSGVLIKVSQQELDFLKKRERGYRCIDVSDKLSQKIDGQVFTFVAPDKEYPRLKVLWSYIDVCLSTIPYDKRDLWLNDTIITNDIEYDIKQPVYPWVPNKP